jgi:hypothetical protein
LPSEWWRASIADPAHGWPSSRVQKVLGKAEVSMQDIETDEYRLLIEQGGNICMTLAQDKAEMGQQLLMAVGISTLFGGGLVHIEGWLPGLILKVHALKSVEHGDQVSIAHVWPSMHARLAAWIDMPSDADALELAFDGAHCVLVPDVFTWHIEPVLFTLKCVAAMPGSA